MHKMIEKAPALEPRYQSTRPAPFAAGLALPRSNDDGRMALAFVAGIVLTACAFLPFLAHH